MNCYNLVTLESTGMNLLSLLEFFQLDNHIFDNSKRVDINIFESDVIFHPKCNNRIHSLDKNSKLSFI